MRHIEPKQTRSEETFARIVDAAERLYRIRRTCDISVRELVEEAHASRSSFYARFPDAEALPPVVFERFCARTLSVAREIESHWNDARPGGHDFRAFVSFVLDRYTTYWRAESRLVQAFRTAEATDPALAGRRQWLDREIPRAVIRVTCVHYPEFDAKRLEKLLDEGMVLIAAAFRGGADTRDQLGLSSPDAHEKMVEGLTELVLRFVADAA